MISLMRNDFSGAPASARGRLAQALTISVIVAAALASGCAKRHSIAVGSIPDDYRTNHPIMIAEKERVLDVAVGASERGATKMQRDAIEGFLARYDSQAAPVLNIMTPVGSSNAVAAGEAASAFAQLAYKNGVPQGRVVMTSYQAGSAEVAAPVRLSYSSIQAQTEKCGRWPKDLADTSDNKHYANFGCANQNNLAAQIANPNDLLGPRKPAPIDAENRSAVIDDYRTPSTRWSPETSY